MTIVEIGVAVLLVDISPIFLDTCVDCFPVSDKANVQDKGNNGTTRDTVRHRSSMDVT